MRRRLPRHGGDLWDELRVEAHLRRIAVARARMRDGWDDNRSGVC